MELERINSGALDDLPHLLARRIYEQAHIRNERGKRGDNLRRGFGRDIAGTFRIEYKSQSVGARFHSAYGIFAAGYAAYLDFDMHAQTIHR